MSEGVDESEIGEARGPVEHERIYAVADWQMYGLEWLMYLAKAPEDLSFRLANGYTHATLWCLTRLDSELRHRPPDKRLVEPAADFHSLLPFSDEELSGLVQRMKTHEAPKNSPESSDSWYNSATDQDIVLVERWRRWLDRNFSEATVDQPTTEGHRMIAALQDMNKALDDIT